MIVKPTLNVDNNRNNKPTDKNRNRNDGKDRLFIGDDMH